MVEVNYKTSDLVDQFGAELAVCQIQFRDLGGRTAFAGPIRTLKVFEDNALVKRVLSSSGDGAVLVVDGGGSLRTALVGGVIAGLAVENNWAGLIIWGAVRDLDELSDLPIGLKALGATPQLSAKSGAGHQDIPVSFGGATFSPNTWVAADADGVVIRNEPPAPKILSISTPTRRNQQA